MVKPKITQPQVHLYTPADIRAKLTTFAAQHARGFVRVVAFRGYYMDTMGEPGENDRGMYDDCFCVIWKDGYLTFNANTDPSRYRDATDKKQGIATLVPGLHYFKKGKHGISGPNPYNAFRPATPDESLPVWRDGENFGKKIYKGIAINIHRGGYNTTSSEGCQTVYPDQWNEFQVKVYDLMTEYKQELLPYALIEWKQ